MDLKIFKTKKNFKKGNFGKKPYLFWKLILATVFLMLALSFGFGFYVFSRVNRDLVLSEDDLGGQIQTVSMARLNGVLKYFADKENKSNEILKEVVPIVDPSL